MAASTSFIAAEGFAPDSVVPVKKACILANNGEILVHQSMLMFLAYAK